MEPAPDPEPSTSHSGVEGLSENLDGARGTQDTTKNSNQQGSVVIKKEPSLEGDGLPWKFKNGSGQEDVIDLISDDEGGGDAAKVMPSLDLGQSILQPLQVTVGGSIASNAKERILQAQRSIATKMKARQQAATAKRHDASLQADQTNDIIEETSDFMIVDEGMEADEETPEDAAAIPAPRRTKASQRARANDAIAAEFKKRKAAYMRKKNMGKATLPEEIEFLRFEDAENARLRKLEADEEYDRTPTPDITSKDNDIFVSDSDIAAPSFPFLDSDDDDEEPKQKKRGRKRKFADDSGDETLKQSKARRVGKLQGKAAKSKKPASETSAYFGGDMEAVMALGRKNAGMNNRSKKSVPPKAKASRKKAGPVITNTKSLFSSDVFQDTAATAHLADQPGFDKTGRRPDALKQLIASVPQDSKKIAQMDKRYLDNAIKAFTGVASVKPAGNGHWTVKGMKSTLKHYQVLGTAFMRQRENDSHEPKGGILADQMGLGKTVMMLANIVNGRPQPNAKLRTTLIVASPALVGQWYQEILKHCEDIRQTKNHGIGHVLMYRAGERIVGNATKEILERCDIVLTTYHEVAKSYPKAAIPPALVTAAQKDQWWKKTYHEQRGLLHSMNFFRIVLDEAQAIKNHKGHTSMACRAVEARHHWAITGTPVMNTIKEFYPYFKFLREPNTGSYKIFKENFCSPDDPDGTEKLNIFLRKFMIRRTHIDRLFDARLLDLPTPKEQTVWLEFNEVERQIYEIVKKRFIQRVNVMSKTGALDRQYSHIWTMILRLRQITGHILLVQGTILDLLEREDFEKLNKITEDEENMTDEGGSLLLHLRNVLSNNHGTKHVESGLGNIVTEVESLPNGTVDITNTEGRVGSKHGLSFRFRKYLSSLKDTNHWDAITQRTLCSGCRQPPKDPQVTSCFHIYCAACLHDLQHLAARRGHDGARCSECGEQYYETKPCEDLETYMHSESTASSSQASQPSQPTKAGRPKKNKGDEIEDWIGMKGEVLPSAKTMACKAQVLNWLQEEPDVKIIIYTQFLPIIRILAKICETESWGYCKYTGAMSHESREKAIKEFGANKDKQILLASLKCGGLGLNLTMASRVICFDPWWNAAVEQQAFCRVFRIGQQKETRMTRFVVKNTIDAAMMQMKERKQVEIDEVMDDSKRNEKLTVEDLMRLFGNVGQDGEGRSFIFAEGDDEDEHLRLPNIDSEDEEQMMGNEE